MEASKAVDLLVLGQAYVGVGDKLWHTEGLLAGLTIGVAARTPRPSRNSKRTRDMISRDMSTRDTIASLARVWRTNSQFACFCRLPSLTLGLLVCRGTFPLIRPWMFIMKTAADMNVSVVGYIAKDISSGAMLSTRPKHTTTSFCRSWESPERPQTVLEAVLTLGRPLRGCHSTRAEGNLFPSSHCPFPKARKLRRRTHLSQKVRHSARTEGVQGLRRYRRA